MIGIVLGGYLFSDTQRRWFLAFQECGGTCLETNELLGLVASIGIQNFPAFVPSVVTECDRTLVIAHPAPQSAIHYVIVPKRDIKNISQLSDEDREFLIDSFAVAANRKGKESGQL